MSEWTTRTLDEHIQLGNIELGRGDVISKVDIEAYPGPYPIYSSSAQGEGKFGEYGKYMFDEELISWSVDGGGNFFYRPKHRFSVTNVSGYLRIKTKELSYRFVYYSLALQHRNISFDYTTKAHPSVIRKLYSIPSIPRHVQDRIAEILATLDRSIERTESLIAKYQQIKAGLMHDLFSRGVTADGKLRPPREQAPELYQETPIGWIPKEWQYELLDKLALRGSGHTPNKNFPEYWNGGVKWISLADSYRLDRLYIDETEYEISQLGIQNSSAVLHAAGIVVLSRDAGVGKSAITTVPMAVSQHFMCWRCDARLDKHFLYYWLQFNKRMFENIAMGSTILTIGLPYFRKLRIAAPTNPEEQKRIGECLQSVDRKIFSLEADLHKKKQQKAGLMRDLLTGRVRVRVD